MNTRREPTINPSTLVLPGDGAGMQVVVVHSERSVTAAVLKRAAELVSGLNAKVLLVAVHTVPFPASFASASASHAHLVGQLADLASQSSLSVTTHVVMARDRDEGFRFLLREESTVLVGTKKRPWPTREDRLAGVLAKDGHKVALLYVP